MALADFKPLAKKVAAILNSVAALGAALQASGALSVLSPELTAIAVGVLAVVNALVHALPSPDAAA